MLDCIRLSDGIAICHDFHTLGVVILLCKSRNDPQVCMEIGEVLPQECLLDRLNSTPSMGRLLLFLFQSGLL